MGTYNLYSSFDELMKCGKVKKATKIPIVFNFPNGGVTKGIVIFLRKRNLNQYETLDQR